MDAAYFENTQRVVRSRSTVPVSKFAVVLVIFLFVVILLIFAVVLITISDLVPAPIDLPRYSYRGVITTVEL